MTDYVDPKLTETFLAVRAGAHTLTDVAKAIDRARSTTYRRLVKLRRMGLIAWDYKVPGSIHSLYG